VVVVDVFELDVLHGVELGGKDVVAGVAVVVNVGETHVLAGKRGGEILARRNHKSDAMATQVGVGGDDSEHEGGREGLHRASGKSAEAEWSWKECVAFELHCTIGQFKKAFRCDRRRAVEVEVGTVEAGEYKVVIAGGAEGRTMETLEEKDRQEEVKNLHWQRYKLDTGISRSLAI
jgi:hypothetical protein